MPALGPAGEANARSVVPGTVVVCGATGVRAGPRTVYEGNIDAGVGVPRSPGRSIATCVDPAATVGAVASSGAEVVCDAGIATLFGPTGFRVTSVTPATVVMAPGTPMFEYRDGIPRGRAVPFTANGSL